MTLLWERDALLDLWIAEAIEGKYLCTRTTNNVAILHLDNRVLRQSASDGGHELNKKFAETHHEELEAKRAPFMPAIEPIARAIADQQSQSFLFNKSAPELSQTKIDAAKAKLYRAAVAALTSISEQQEPLGKDFSAVLEENLWGLYSR